MKGSRLIKFFIFLFILLALALGLFCFFEFDLENVFSLKEIETEVLEAQVGGQEVKELKTPIVKKDVQNPQLSAKAIFSLLVSRDEEKVLFEKNNKEVLPIASLTKLLTSFIVLERYSPKKEITISQNAFLKPGNAQGTLKTGESFFTEDLLKAMLVESNNTAAEAFSEAMEKYVFVFLMNDKIKEWGIKDTSFSNPSGLDPKNGTEINQSSAESLAKIAKIILEKKPEIFEILLTKEYDLYTFDGIFNHKAVNTNTLIDEIPLVIGGKTGETPKSGGCLLLITKAPKDRGYIINVILNSPDRFSEMKTLINWLNTSYSW